MVVMAAAKVIVRTASRPTAFRINKKGRVKALNRVKARKPKTSSKRKRGARTVAAKGSPYLDSLIQLAREIPGLFLDCW